MKNGSLKSAILTAVVFLSFVLSTVPATWAGTFTNLYVFGDSLSDAGNVFRAVGQPAPPYYAGRFSNGPVWVEYLAADLGLPTLTPSLAGGTDFAWGGAETGTGSSAVGTPNVGAQVTTYLGTVSNHADPSGLYVVWAGANDVFDFGSSVDVATSAQNIQTAVQELFNAGARQFIVPNMPPLDKTPYGIGNPTLVPALAAASVGFNSNLAADLDLLQTQDAGIQIHNLSLSNPTENVYDLFNQWIANPPPGITNVTTAAYDPSRSPELVPDPDSYFFWDSVHPTTEIDQQLAAAVVPEPSAFVLLLAALLGIAGFAFHRRCL
ncbi:MAG: SGNH/GDSL hydrolase family protein [Thermoguttaceae bacterium]|jgi:phospholipase/lecithinase/hemolysin